MHSSVEPYFWKYAQLDDYDPYLRVSREYLSPAMIGSIAGGLLGAMSAPTPDTVLMRALTGAGLGGVGGWGLSKMYRLGNVIARPYVDPRVPLWKPMIYTGGVGAGLGALAALARQTLGQERPLKDVDWSSVLHGALLGGGIGAIGGLGLRALSSV